MVFISYSSKEYEIADHIREILQENGISCWMAPESIPVGGDYSREIPEAIENCDTFLVVLSQKSQESVWVPKEIDRAVTLRKNIIPLHVDTSEISSSFQFLFTGIQHIEVPRGIDGAAEIIVSRINRNQKIPNASDIKSNLPREITFFELLGVNNSREIDIEKIRSKSDITRSMAVPIGRNDQGDIVTLDLHHKGDGSHGIIIGSAGSGKSEFIYTLFLSLALAFPPDEVRLYIIDFKKDSTVCSMRGLPHLGECLTDYAQDAVTKFVDSIKNELIARTKILERYGVTNIYQYLKLRKRSKEDMPEMPHIVIAFDEIRDLKVAFPQEAKDIQLFGSGLNADIFGVHLIYSTHSVFGIIDDSIARMVNYKICSSMQQNIGITEPVQGERRIPGRLYFQSPSQDVIQLVQLAYCGTTADPNLSSKEELQDFQWFFRSKSQKESLISALERYSLD